jgi:hypothetical protein
MQEYCPHNPNLGSFDWNCRSDWTAVLKTVIPLEEQARISRIHGIYRDVRSREAEVEATGRSLVYHRYPGPTSGAKPLNLHSDWSGL